MAGSALTIHDRGRGLEGGRVSRSPGGRCGARARRRRERARHHARGSRPPEPREQARKEADFEALEGSVAIVADDADVALTSSSAFAAGRLVIHDGISASPTSRFAARPTRSSALSNMPLETRWAYLSRPERSRRRSDGTRLSRAMRRASSTCTGCSSISARHEAHPGDERQRLGAAPMVPAPSRLPSHGPKTARTSSARNVPRLPRLGSLCSLASPGIPRTPRFPDGRSHPSCPAWAPKSGRFTASSSPTSAAPAGPVPREHRHVRSDERARASSRSTRSGSTYWRSRRAAVGDARPPVKRQGASAAAAAAK